MIQMFMDQSNDLELPEPTLSIVNESQSIYYYVYNDSGTHASNITFYDWRQFPTVGVYYSSSQGILNLHKDVFISFDKDFSITECHGCAECMSMTTAISGICPTIGCRARISGFFDEGRSDNSLAQSNYAAARFKFGSSENPSKHTQRLNTFIQYKALALYRYELFMLAKEYKSDYFRKHDI